MKQTPYIILSIIVALAALLWGCACSRSQADLRLEEAESLMEEHPDSALTVIDAIDTLRLDSERERARYALLRSIALDKNLIDTTDFTILQPAIDYYVERDKGTPDEKLRTLYYKGRIFQNRGDDDNAMRAFVTARDYEGSATDTLTLARLLVAQGSIFYAMESWKMFIDNSLLAAKFFKAKNRTALELRCLAKSLSGCISDNDKLRADSILLVSNRIISKYPQYSGLMESEQMRYKIYFGNHNDIRKLIVQYADSSDLSNQILFNLASACLRAEDYSKSLYYIDRLDNSADDFDSIKYLSIKSQALKGRGDMTESIGPLYELDDTVGKLQNKIRSNEAVSIPAKHYLETISVNEKSKRNKAIMIGVLASIVLSVAVIFLLSRYIQSRNRENRQKRRSYRYRDKFNSIKKRNEELELEKRYLELKSEQETNLQERLRLEKDSAILDKRNIELEIINAESRIRQLDSDNTRLQEENISASRELTSQRNHINELASKLSSLQSEYDKLKNILSSRDDMANPISDMIRERLMLMNDILFSHITRNPEDLSRYSNIINALIADRDSFMDSSRLIFTALHPDAILYLEEKNLSRAEINYLMLYALGLNGKEVGYYLKQPSHVETVSDIRRKLGLGKRDTNLRKYVRNLLGQDSEDNNGSVS